jgi:hypothetical protein
MYTVIYKYGRRKEKVVFQSESFKDLMAYIESIDSLSRPSSAEQLKSMAHEGHAIRGKPLGFIIKENKHAIGFIIKNKHAKSNRNAREEWIAIWLGPVPDTKFVRQRSVRQRSMRRQRSVRR